MIDEEVKLKFEKIGYIVKVDNEEKIELYKNNHGPCCCYDEVITYYRETDSYNKYDGSRCGFQMQPTEEELELITEIARTEI